MKILCIIQARMDSGRLPGKVLADLGGVSVLDLLIKRVSESRSIDNLVVATTTNQKDDVLAEHLVNEKIPYFRGSEFDVLDRFSECARHFGEPDVVVRLTADCPFVDAELIDEVIQKLVAEKLDYCSNRLPPPFSRTYPVGLDVEAFTYRELLRANESAILPYEREHVTPHMYGSKSNRQTAVLSLAEDLSSIRLTIDEQQDLSFCRDLYSKFDHDLLSWPQIVSFAKKARPVNSNIKQKSGFSVDPRWLA